MFKERFLSLRLQKKDVWEKAEWTETDGQSKTVRGSMINP